MENDLKKVAKIVKLIRKIQDNPEKSQESLLPFLNSLSKVQVVGVTGAPYVGKSSLIDKIIYYLRKDGKKVSVLAIDPSSPVSGGAFLGDRLRMRDHDLDPGVFIHSLASRQSEGGLPEGLDLMIRSAALFGDITIVETVGSGQHDIGIAKLVDTLLVVFEPSGDEISCLKSGPWELAHIIVVNKCDKDFADRFYENLRANLVSPSPFPIILKTKTLYPEEGVKEVAEGIYKHWEYLKTTKAAQ